ncbi:MAG TPA: glutamyl-tRNA reductase [Ktedonobacterales bacterium]|jgi:glutamyl-tRNA reductase|nr:glutamyl-tRNA reductase [Ktedonobacterales bacterium]
MIAVVGLDHRRASVEARGRLAFADDRLAGALNTLGGDQWIDEVVILSTCNRTEVYLASQRPMEALHSARRLLEQTYLSAEAVESAAPAPPGSRSSVAIEAPAELAQALYTHEGIAVVNHLYEVAAGLRSMVIGEPQILGQTRASLAAAEAEQTVGDELRALFTGALKIGKRVRAETEINRADVSVAGLGVRVARETLGALRGKTALLIGAGRTNQLGGRLLRDEGIGQLFVANRSLASAEALAQQLEGHATPLDEIEPVIAQADLIISATAAPHPVLSTATIAAGRVGRTTPLVVVDLAVPGDLPADVATLPGVTLLTLDTLRDMADPEAHNDPAVIASLHGRERDIEQSRQIIAEGLRDYARAQTMRLAVPGIAALRQHVDRSEEQELAHTLAQLDHLSDRDRAIIERFGSRLVDKMFHHLVRRIRSLAEYDEIPPDVTMQVLAQLFSEPAGRDRDSSQ